jgi:hypothetical protein
MAFPPSHLPRNTASGDISSRILSKIASTSAKALNADLAASWVEELNQAILESKVHYSIFNSYTARTDAPVDQNTRADTWRPSIV